MGIYIEPKDGSSKEAWLSKKNARNIAASEIETSYDLFRFQEEVPLVLVDNGLFKALAVAYDYREAMRFLSDQKRMSYWVVPLASLKDSVSKNTYNSLLDTNII